MFTGLIQKVGRMAGLRTAAGGATITVAHEPWEERLELGESVAVQGVCLSVARSAPAQFACDVLDETLNRTSLGKMTSGTPLNLERALRAGDRFGGHFVTGHVDGTGKVLKIKESGRDWVLGVECPEDLMRGIILKGSIACDGVSLTVTAVTKSSFEVHLIPLTWSGTSLSRLRSGDTVNIETDMIGKYVQRQLAEGKTAGGLTMDTLRETGFA